MKKTLSLCAAQFVPLAPPSLSGTGTAALRSVRRDAGFTLIEVLVALIVLVLGVLGAAAMTLTALRDSKQSGLRSQASAMAYEIGDLMRANGSGQETVFTGAAPTATATCWSTGCPEINMARNDYFEWLAKLTGTRGLPNGTAVICRDASFVMSPTACDNLPTSPLVVKLRWDEKVNYARGQATSSSAAVIAQTLSVPIQPY